MPVCVQWAGRVRDGAALLRVWLPRPRPWALCQRWGLAPGPGWGALTERFLRAPPPRSHRRQITMSPGKEVDEAQMCVLLTSVHSKTSGHLFVFVCVRVCTPVLVCAPPTVCPCLSLSPRVWLVVYAWPHDCVSVRVCLSLSVATGHCASSVCACPSGAASIPRDCLFVAVGLCGLGVRECCAFEAVGLDLSVCVLCLCM